MCAWRGGGSSATTSKPAECTVPVFNTAEPLAYDDRLQRACAAMGAMSAWVIPSMRVTEMAVAPGGGMKAPFFTTPLRFKWLSENTKRARASASPTSKGRPEGSVSAGRKALQVGQ